MSKLTGFSITKDQLTAKANKAIETYQNEFKSRTGGTITRSMAAVKLLEKYSESVIDFKNAK